MSVQIMERPLNSPRQFAQVELAPKGLADYQTQIAQYEAQILAQWTGTLEELAKIWGLNLSNEELAAHINKEDPVFLSHEDMDFRIARRRATFEEYAKAEKEKERLKRSVKPDMGSSGLVPMLAFIGIVGAAAASRVLSSREERARQRAEKAV